MTGRLLKIGVPVALLALVVTAWAANTPEQMAQRHRTMDVQRTHVVYDTRYLPTADGPSNNLMRPMMTETRSILDDRHTAKAPLRVRTAGASSPIVTPITVYNATSYDFQHNDEGMRQCAKLDGDDYTNFAITYWNVIPESLDQVNRYVSYNAWDNGSSSLTLGANGDLISAAVGGDINSMRAGFTTLDVGSDGNSAVTFHARGEPSQPSGTYSSWVIETGFPGLAIYSTSELPSSVNEETIWPHITADRGGSLVKSPGDDIFHVTAHPFEVNDHIYYYRRIGGYVNGSTDWQGPIFIDESTLLSYHVAACPNTASAPKNDDISIAYMRDQDNAQGLLDVVYVTSSNDGADWIAYAGTHPGVAVGPAVNGGRHNVTNYSDPNGSAAWTEVVSSYDKDGRYHVVWIEQVNANSTADARVMHWDDIATTPRIIAQAVGFANVGGIGGRDLWLAFPEIGFGDGATQCNDGPANPGSGGANTNNGYLYVTYEQYGGETAVEANDASVTPQQNLEVYLSVSNDHGNTWSPAVNLTNTKTPGCDGTVGNECASERDPSIAGVIDDAIHVMYIEDIDAGDAVFGQGVWTFNPVHYLRIPGGTDVQPVCPQIAPSFAARLSNQEPGCEYNAPRGQSQIESLTIQNLGNAALTGSVTTDGAAWLQMTTGAYNVPAAGADNVRTVTMNAAVAPLSTTEGLYQDAIHITHNDPNKVSPRDIPVDFFVFDEFYCPEHVILNTGWLWLDVSSVEEVTATKDDRGGLTRLRPGTGDTSWSIYDGSLLIGEQDSPPDTLVFMHFNNVCQPCNTNLGYRALGHLVVDTSAYGTGTGAATATAKQCTSDSTIGVDVTYIFPQASDSGQMVLIKYKLYNRTNVAINNLFVGEGVDFDVTPGADQGSVQPGSQNTGYVDQNFNLVYQQGVDTAGHVVAGNNTATRFKGGMSMVSATASPRAWVGQNDPFLFSNPGGYFYQGYLYREMNKSGFEVFPQTSGANPEEDLHSVLTFDQNVDLAPGATRLFCLALVSSDQGADDPTDLYNTVKKAWKYCFGWSDFSQFEETAVSTPKTWPYHATGSYENGLGTCEGCVITEVDDASGLFSQSGACDGTITFAGTATAGCYSATYRVATPCGGYSEDCVVTVSVGGANCSCDCPHQGDIDVSGFVDGTDLAYEIDLVFFGGVDPGDPGCPTTRGDFNGDGFSDGTDLAFVIDYVFFGGVGPTNPCP